MIRLLAIVTAIGACTADECRILVAAIERRLGKLNKGDDKDAR